MKLSFAIPCFILLLAASNAHAGTSYFKGAGSLEFADGKKIDGIPFLAQIDVSDAKDRVSFRILRQGGGKNVFLDYTRSAERNTDGQWTSIPDARARARFKENRLESLVMIAMEPNGNRKISTVEQFKEGELTITNSVLQADRKESVIDYLKGSEISKADFERSLIGHTLVAPKQ